MKGLYIAPELEIVKFLNEDILTATAPGLDVGEGDVDVGEGNDDENIGWS